jgi:hypothetical protein
VYGSGVYRLCVIECSPDSRETLLLEVSASRYQRREIRYLELGKGIYPFGKRRTRFKLKEMQTQNWSTNKYTARTIFHPCERENKCVCFSVCVCVFYWKQRKNRIRVCVCVCWKVQAVQQTTERESVCVCVCVSVSACACMRLCVSVCV